MVNFHEQIQNLKRPFHRDRDRRSELQRGGGDPRAREQHYQQAGSATRSETVPVTARRPWRSDTSRGGTTAFGQDASGQAGQAGGGAAKEAGGEGENGHMKAIFVLGNGDVRFSESHDDDHGRPHQLIEHTESDRYRALDSLSKDSGAFDRPVPTIRRIFKQVSTRPLVYVEVGF